MDRERSKQIADMIAKSSANVFQESMEEFKAMGEDDDKVGELADRISNRLVEAMQRVFDEELNDMEAREVLAETVARQCLVVYKNCLVKHLLGRQPKG